MLTKFMWCKNTREALLINPVRFTSYTFKAVNGESSYHVVRELSPVIIVI